MLVKPVLIILAALLLFQQSRAESFPAEAVRDDLELAREALSRIHPGYDRYTSEQELDRLWTTLDAGLGDTVAFEDTYLALSRILAAIRCDHTKAELPERREAARSNEPLFLPFRFAVFADDGSHRMYVDVPGDTGLERGEEILTIDGAAVQDRIADILPLIPVDGFTDHVKPLVVAKSSEFMGSGFDHFDPLLRSVPAVARLLVRGLDGELRLVEAPRVGFDDYQALDGSRRYGRNFADPDMARVTFPVEGVAVLSVDTFVNYRNPVDPQSVYAPLFEAIRDRDTHTLILDLRRNGGGSTDARNALLARLIDRPTPVARDIRVKTIDLEGLREHLDTWEQAALNPKPDYFNRRGDGWWSLRPEFGGAGGPIEPHPAAFTGRLTILTSRANSSGSTGLVAALQEAGRNSGRVRLVGEPTGGSQEGPTAGIIFFLTLPNTGIVVRVPYQLTEQAISNPVYGRGFDPDLPAIVTYESWLAGTDVVLEAAVAEASE